MSDLDDDSCPAGASALPRMSSLKFDLEVLASTCIKRKKPWPKLAFLDESVFLLDKQRASVLYMGTGKTKRKIPKLQPLLSHAVLLTHSSNGAFVGGLLSDGNLFLWHKCSDTLKHVSGIPRFVQQPYLGSGRVPYLCIAGSGSMMLLVTSLCEIFVWEIDLRQSFFQTKEANVRGTWSRVEPTSTFPFAASAHVEMAVHAVFTVNNMTLGQHCICSFVYYADENINVSSLLLHWFTGQDVYSNRLPTFSSDWQTTSFPISSLGSLMQPVVECGAFVVRHSNDAQLLAVAVNQLNSFCSRLVFVAPLPAVTTVRSLHNMGTRLPVTANPQCKSYWVADMEWTHDDLLLAIMTGQGSVCLVPRLGEPFLIQTRGRSINMGPKFFLPLHPLVSVKSQSATTDNNPMRQRFSVAVHPSRQLILFSDGYMVTAVEPCEWSGTGSCLALMKRLVTNAERRLARVVRLRSSFFVRLNNYQLPESAAHRRGLSTGVDEIEPERPRYRFEMTPMDAAGGTLDPEEFASGVLANADSGRVIFGDTDNLLATCSLPENAALSDATTETLDSAMKYLVVSWGLAATHAGVWTTDHESIAGNVTRGFIRLFAAFLQNSAAEKTGAESGVPQVLHLYRRILGLSSMDYLGRHLPVLLLNFVRQTVELLLRSRLVGRRVRMRVLGGVALALQYAEQHFVQTYTLGAPRRLRQVDALPYSDSAFVDADLFRLPSAFKADNAKSVTNGNIGASYQNSLVKSHRCPSLDSRLAGCWLILYKHTVQHYGTLHRAHQHAHNTRRKSDTSMKLHKTLKLMAVITARLNRLNVRLPQHRRTKLTAGESLFIEEDAEDAIDAWIRLLQNLPDNKMGNVVVSRTLHAILYARLARYQLVEAIMLVELVLRLPDVRQVANIYGSASDHSLMSALAVPVKLPRARNTASQPQQLLFSRAARRLVQSLARIMASYFTNAEMFIFPPHNAVPIPPLDATLDAGMRIMPLQRDEVTRQIGESQLGTFWTSGRALEYLLLSGLLPEAVWFVGRLGDWKAQFIMSAVVHRHALTSSSEKSRTKMLLSLDLQPETLVKDRLIAAVTAKFVIYQAVDEFPSSTRRQSDVRNLTITLEMTLNQRNEAANTESAVDIDQLTKSVSDTLLCALIVGNVGVDTTCILLRQLVDHLRDAVQQFKVLVPEAVYLPAPPIYCPQPVITDEERQSMAEDQLAEMKLRHQVAQLIRHIVVVFRASRCAAPSIYWYSAKLIRAFVRGKQLKGEDRHISAADQLETLATYASTRTMFAGRETETSISTILGCFRDVCCFVWLLVGRDSLSLSLRQKASDFEKQLNRQAQFGSSQWFQRCSETLRHSINLLPFSNFLSADRQLQCIILSLIVELPRTGDTAEMLADLFPDCDSLEPDARNKLQWILKEWQGVFLSDRPQSVVMPDEDESIDGNVAMPRGTTLAVKYYLKARGHERSLSRKQRAFGQYTEKIFATENPSDDASLRIGSRPCESSRDFLVFLETFFHICFASDLNERDDRLPLIDVFADTIRRKEMDSMPLTTKKPDMKNPQTVRRSVSVHLQSSVTSETLEKTKIVERTVYVPLKREAKTLYGMFRSRSVGELSSVSDGSPLVDRRQSLQPVEIDVLSSRPRFGVQRSSSVVSTSSARNVNNNNAHIGSRQLRRSVSMSAAVKVKQAESEEDISKCSVNYLEYLSESVLEPSAVDCIQFIGNFVETEKMAEWLSGWSGRHITRGANGSSAMRIRVAPKMLTYSLWLVDNCRFENLARVDGTTVAMVQPGGKVHVQSGIVASAASHLVMSPPSISSISDTHDSSSVITKQRSSSEKKKHRHGHRKQVRQAEVENSVSSHPSESCDLEVGEMGMKTWGTKRLSFASSRRVAADLSNTNSNNNAPGTTTSSESLSVSVSSNLEDEDVVNLQKTMRETLARISRGGTGNFEDTGNQLQLLTGVQGDPVQTAHSPLLATAVSTTGRQPVGAAVGAAVASGGGTQQLMGQDLVGQLQKAVRDEMRRIMEAQHQGIVAMLNALDGGSNATFVRSFDNPLQPGTGTVQPQPAPAVMVETIQRQKPVHTLPPTHTLPAAEPTQSDDISTDATVTPIPNDDLSKKLLSPDRTMELTDLEKSKGAGRNKAPVMHAKAQPVLHGALAELNRLQNSVGGLRFLQIPPPSSAGNVVRGKENNPQQSSRPFGDLMDTLRRMNRELGGGRGAGGKAVAVIQEPAPEPFRLLRLPSPHGCDFPVKLPRVVVPHPAVPPGSFRQQKPETPQPVPCLAKSQQPVDVSPPPPPRPSENTFLKLNGNVAPPSGIPPGFFRHGLPFPMLRMMDLGSCPVPYFVPPENLAGFRQQQQPIAAADSKVEKLEPQNVQSLEKLSRKSPELLKFDEASIQKTRRKQQTKKQKPPEPEESNDETEPAIMSEPVAAKHAKATSRPHVHSGYAFTPGMFDQYLNEQPELGSDMLSYAQLQYQAVMGLQGRQPVLLKKDMYTETDDVQSGNPVSELIENYNREQVAVREQQVAAGPLLPPDVFVQLQYQSSANKQAGPSRAFLNVADIGADALNDIYAATTSQRPTQQTAAEVGTSSKQPSLQSGSPVHDEKPATADRVTAEMLTRVATRQQHLPQHDALRTIGKSSQRNQMLVNDMNAKLQAIEAMTRNMDRDLQNTRLVVGALDEVNDRQSGPGGRSSDHSDRALEQGSQSAVSQSSPSPRQMPSSPQRIPSLTPRQVATSPQHQPSLARNDTASHDVKMQDSSSLHDRALADFLESNMETCDYDPDPTHIPQWPKGFASKMLSQAIQATHDGVRLSRDDLKSLFQALSPPETLTFPPHIPTNDELEKRRQREAVHKWMEKRKAEQMKEYVRKRSELREAEKNPYKPAENAQKPVTSKDLEAASKERQAQRECLQRAILDLRNQKASQLTRELLSDEPPQLPLETSLAMDTPRSSRPSRPASKVPATRKKPTAKVAWTDPDDVENLNAYLMSLYDEDELLMEMADQDVENASPRKIIAKERPASAGSMPERDAKSVNPQATYRPPRPFTDIVRLQKPATMRRNWERVRSVLEARSADSAKAATQTINKTSFDRPQPTPEPSVHKTSSAPRVVKTYVERLQEMKQSASSTPIRTITIRRPSTGSRPQSHRSEAAASAASQPPRKTMTYAEQLKSLQVPRMAPPQPQHRPGTGQKRTAASPSHKPRHEPKTYAQQLKELQQHNTPGPYKSGAPHRHHARSRPYGDPYSSSAEFSALSTWSADDEAARRLIYDDRSTSDILDFTNTGDFDRVTNNDVDNLADLESIMSDVSNVSWSSFLDWGEVDKLIAENA